MRKNIPDPRKPVKIRKLRYIPKIRKLRGILEGADLPNELPHAPYDPNLLSVLESEHVQLLETFHQLYDTAVNKPAAGKEQIYTLLSDFSLKLIEHFVHEDYQFYPYLKESMTSPSDENSDTFKEFHDEMMDIEHDIRLLVDRYDVRRNFWARDENGSEKNALAKSLSLIGILLKERIIREEAYLYPLYKAKPK